MEAISDDFEFQWFWWLITIPYGCRPSVKLLTWTACNNADNKNHPLMESPGACIASSGSDTIRTAIVSALAADEDEEDDDYDYYFVDIINWWVFHNLMSSPRRFSPQRRSLTTPPEASAPGVWPAQRHRTKLRIVVSDFSSGFCIRGCILSKTKLRALQIFLYFGVCECDGGGQEIPLS